MHQPARIVQLEQFRPAAVLAHLGLTLDAPPGRHPEGASTPCQCRAPEPCWAHMPGVVLPGYPELRPAPESAVVAELTAAAAVTEADAGWAPTVCQCSAPEACREHPDDAPWIARPPEGHEPPHPDSPVGRTIARHAAERAAGVLPGAEPGQGAAVLPFLTDHELGAWTQALLAEHHRRQSRFADYRAGARAAGLS